MIVYNNKHIKAWLLLQIPVTFVNKINKNFSGLAVYGPDHAEINKTDNIIRQYKDISSKREVWVAVNVSPGFVKGVSNLGWSVRSDLRARVLPEIPWGLQDEGN